jgi:hypothetical protein
MKTLDADTSIQVTGPTFCRLHLLFDKHHE